jgi:predicted permease
MHYLPQLFYLMIEVMLPVSLLVSIGAIWPLLFPGTAVAALRTQLNKLVLYIFYPAIAFVVGATTKLTFDLLSVPLLYGISVIISASILYWILYVSSVGKKLENKTRAILMLGGMFGNIFTIGGPVLIFFFGADATRYAVVNDIFMGFPLIWTLGVWIATRLGSGHADDHQPIWRGVLLIPPIPAFLLGLLLQYFGLVYAPFIKAANMIAQPTIPLMLFILGITIPWRSLKPRREIVIVAAIKLLVAPVIVWAIARLFFEPMREPQFAAVVEGATPVFLTGLLIADRFKLDHEAAALLVGWSTIFFWLSLSLFTVLGLFGN